MKELFSKLKENRRAGLIGASLAAGAGLLLLGTGLGEPAANFSYDLACLRARPAPDDVVQVEMDEPAYRALRQDYDKLWDRSLHARLVEQLQRDGARLVVLDVFLADSGTNSLSGEALVAAKERNARLAAAIRSNPRVVLAADRTDATHLGVVGESVMPPFAEFEMAASNRWGIAKAEMDSDLTVRRHYLGTENDPSLAWRAAEMLGATVAQEPGRRLHERWLRYYGPSPAFRRLSFHVALEQSAGFFKDKLVFIGGRPRTLMVGQQTDVFRTPHMRWRSEYTPGVEIMATTVLNLWRGDWYRRAPASVEIMLALGVALLAGFGLSLARPLTATLLAVTGMIAVAVGGLAISWTTNIWFSWMAVAGVMIPVALIWAVLWNTRRLQEEKRALEKSLAQFQAGQVPFAQPGVPVAQPVDDQSPTTLEPNPAGASARASERSSPDQPPPIPNHRMIKRIGRGGYGEVWLAQDELGFHHAVKVIYRTQFSSAAPFDREFHGLQQFTPISRNHAGLVHILHVGRNEREGYFFYIMELADSVDGTTNPVTYSARSLMTEMHVRRRLPAGECIELFLHLTAALEYLHQRLLVHRDIKPSNIIFVGGQPKFADIGLVTAVTAETSDSAYVGTQGYIAPEGPGRPQADIFALGMVLYEALMGRSGLEFPSLPSTLVEGGGSPEVFELNRIVMKACAEQPGRRYRTAAEMHRDLLQLKRRLNPVRVSGLEAEPA